MKIACVVGTRPEAIKMAPVIREIGYRKGIDPVVVLTGQHRDLARQALNWFEIEADHDLSVMIPGQSLSDLSARLFSCFDDLWERLRPDLAVVQGDTTSAMVAAVSAFHRHIPIAHVEAGLRTHDTQSPFPEEMNRSIIGRVANLHFSPTAKSRTNLIRENIRKADIAVTGNTVIDALFHIAAQSRSSGYPRNPDHGLVLVSIHRRENLGPRLSRICKALRTLHDNFPHTEFVLPVHPNPNVSRTVHKLLAGLPRFHLTPSLDYPVLVDLLKRARFILTDSGGLQEEGPAMGKPVLILREETERGEILDAGIGMLVGSDSKRILTEAARLIADDDHWQKMADGGSPFGDGRASIRIVDRCIDYLNRARKEARA